MATLERLSSCLTLLLGPFSKTTGILLWFLCDNCLLLDFLWNNDLCRDIYNVFRGSIHNRAALVACSILFAKDLINQEQESINI